MTESTEGLNLHPMGTVTLSWEREGQEPFSTTLKRPKMRQYRQSQELLNEVSQQAQEVRKNLRALQQELVREQQKQTAETDADVLAEYDEKLQEIAGKIDEQIAELDLGPIRWFERTNEVLGSVQLKATTNDSGEPVRDRFGFIVYDRDDYPVWLLDRELPRKIVEHWKTVPLAPGSKGTNS